MQNINSGFTLIEILIVIAIIGILIMIAIPSYRIYTRRAHYIEVIQSTSPYKIGVEECYQTTANLKNCSSGSNGIPPQFTSGKGSGLVNKISVKAGVIQVTPKTVYGITSKDTYILTPTVEGNQLVWKASGGGVSVGYAR